MTTTDILGGVRSSPIGLIHAALMGPVDPFGVGVLLAGHPIGPNMQDDDGLDRSIGGQAG